MIDQGQFGLIMASFADRIGRPLATFTARMYYDVLSAELTTEEFLAAARVVFKTHAYNTWPAPQQFIAAVKPQNDPALTGAEFFELIVGRNDPRRVATSLGPIALRAFEIAGGNREFSGVLECDVHFLRRRFVDAFVAASSEGEAQGQARVALANVDPKAAALIGQTAKALQIDRQRLAAGERDE